MWQGSGGGSWSWCSSVAEVCKYPHRVGEGTGTGTTPGGLLAAGTAAASPHPTEVRGGLCPQHPPARSQENLLVRHGQAQRAPAMPSAHQTEREGHFILFLTPWPERIPYADRESRAVQLRTSVVLLPTSAVPGLPVPFSLTASVPSLPKAWLRWGVSAATEGFGWLENILPCLPRAGGKAAGSSGLSSSLTLHGSAPCARRRTGPRQGRAGGSRCRQHAPKPPARA